MTRIQITEKTSIPLGWLVSAASFFVTAGVGSVFWLTTLYADVAESKKALAELKVESKNDRREFARTLNRMDRGLLRVQLKLGIQPDPVPSDDP